MTGRSKVMYGASGSGNNQQPTGVNIAIEPGFEWKIKEIEFDGVEKYVSPPNFVDHVARLAHKVDWRKLIGSDATYDNPDTIARDDGEEIDEDEVESVVLEMEDRKTPEAGPWHSVARYLHESLQQVNVLLDTLAVQKMSYMKALTVVDLFESQHNMPEVVQQSKQFQWVAKRKALTEAAGVLELGQKLRSKLYAETDSNKEMFFRELRKMRELWRVRKTNNMTHGDLSYKMFGPKYRPREIFDIMRRSATLDSVAETSNASCLQVQVPCDLIRRSNIAVSIEIDDMDSKDVFATSDNDLDFTKITLEEAKEVHWSKALQWAQESLICRDIFRRLCEDAVLMQDRITSFRDNVLIASLFDNVLLRVELCYYPFKDGPLPAAGDDYLNRALRQLFVNDQCTRILRHQTFVAMPLTYLPERLDLRGPYAMTGKEIKARKVKKTSLLTRMIAVASHFVLINRVSTSLKQYMLRTTDPQVTWKWLRAASVQSSIVVTATNRNYDYAGKTTFYVRIGTDDFHIATKEGQILECWRDADALLKNVDMLVCNYMMNTVAMIASKLWQWQVLHANVNATDDESNPSPTVYLCNHSGTRVLFMKFHLGKPPTIQVGKRKPDQPASLETPGDFTTLNFNRLIGSSLCKKVDNLCAMLKN